MPWPLIITEIIWPLWPTSTSKANTSLTVWSIIKRQECVATAVSQAHNPGITLEWDAASHDSLFLIILLLTGNSKYLIQARQQDLCVLSNLFNGPIRYSCRHGWLQLAYTKALSSNIPYFLHIRTSKYHQPSDYNPPLCKTVFKGTPSLC